LRLIELMNEAMTEQVQGTDFAGREISGLACDSRNVQQGFLFAALPGVSADGGDFVDDALARGAAAVLADPGVTAPNDVPLIHDPNPRRAFARMAARFYRAQPERVCAVTGTNGKTSVVSFLRQIWTALGLKAASIGTLGVTGPSGSTPGSLTTPDAVQLHEALRDLAQEGVDYLAMEASSHGLDQYRLDGVRIAAAAFTTLGRDHLDYHGDQDAYLDAKLRLFSEILIPGGVAVINAASEAAGAIERAAADRGCRVIDYGEEAKDIRLKSLDAVAGGQNMQLELMGEAVDVTLPLMGRFQAENALCALALAIACGADAKAAAAALEQLDEVPGRLQRIGETKTGADVIVDYAHTPDALKAVLETLRPHVSGRLHVVFGCGGDRDRAKRPEMGRAATELADRIIVTDDNPRTENPAAIRAEILTACEGALEIADRRQAIEAAIGGLGPGDVLVVAGKGHEQGQIVGDKVHPFNDGDVVLEAILAAGEEGA